MTDSNELFVNLEVSGLGGASTATAQSGKFMGGKIGTKKKLTSIKTNEKVPKTS